MAEKKWTVQKRAGRAVKGGDVPYEDIASMPESEAIALANAVKDYRKAQAYRFTDKDGTAVKCSEMADKGDPSQDDRDTARTKYMSDLEQGKSRGSRKTPETPHTAKTPVRTYADALKVLGGLSADDWADKLGVNTEGTDPETIAEQVDSLITEAADIQEALGYLKEGLSDRIKQVKIERFKALASELGADPAEVAKLVK